MSRRRIRPTQEPKINSPVQQNSYSLFDQINGYHPWQEKVPEGFVAYPVRVIPEAKVIYFNFSLAKEMGLLPKNHPHKVSPALHEKIVQTFSLRIINEYDQKAGVKYQPHLIKPNPYMATRYLQLQHKSKRGHTSGDGRSIWNGVFKGKDQAWDISSRGTGVTCLSPGAAAASRPLKTGVGTYGYGCGQADVPELLGSAIMSEIFHYQGIHTERVLAVLDLGNNVGIGVRAAPNLLRPAHFFMYLKQSRIEPLRRAVDYLIQRQIENKKWNFSPNSKLKYQEMLRQIATEFGEFAALLEREYVFAWMEWDGDNILAQAGIIDYGSVRRFGLRHDQYRYDDVERWSTNLNEQKYKAQLTVQIFAQLVHYLESGRRLGFEKFDDHWAVKLFKETYHEGLAKTFLRQMGFNEKQLMTLLQSHRRTVQRALFEFEALEKIKIQNRAVRLPDGVNRPAAYNMKRVLCDLAEEMTRLPAGENILGHINAKWVFERMVSGFAKGKDRRLSKPLAAKILAFLNSYRKLVRAVFDKSEGSLPAKLSEFHALARRWTGPGRLTGNGGEFVVQELMKAYKKGFPAPELQTAIDLFISQQSGAPRTMPVSLDTPAGELLQVLIETAEESDEDI